MGSRCSGPESRSTIASKINEGLTPDGPGLVSVEIEDRFNDLKRQFRKSFKNLDDILFRLGSEFLTALFEWSRYVLAGKLRALNSIHFLGVP